MVNAWVTSLLIASTLAACVPDDARDGDKGGLRRKIAPSSAALRSSISIEPTLRLVNARDAGSLQSGFLIGVASSDQGIDHVEVSLDDGAWAEAEGGASWSFKLPVGSAWRRGTLHRIKVRAIDVNGLSSDELSVTVRRGANHDVNGDGFVDLVTAAPRYAGGPTDSGRVYVFYGTGSGISPSARSSTNAETTLSGAEAQGLFGSSLAVGDVDGDGYAELIAGAPGIGRVYVFQGSAQGLPSGVLGDVPATQIEGGGDAKEFGKAALAADFNGDGFDDVVVADAQPSASLYRGSESGLSSEASVVVAGPRTIQGIAVSDLNADGNADLIVGDSLGSERGVVRIHYGSHSGVSRIPTETIVGGAALSGFGATVAAGDINGDLFIDLIVTSSKGELRLFKGSAAGINALGGRAGAAESRLMAPELRGARVTTTTCDLNHDGADELLIGVSTVNDGRGAIYTLDGGATAWPVKARLSDVVDLKIEGAALGDELGYALSCDLDFNDDGAADVVAGAPGTASGLRNYGRVYLLVSDSSGPSLAGDVESVATNAIFSDSAGARFGESL